MSEKLIGIAALVIGLGAVAGSAFLPTGLAALVLGGAGVLTIALGLLSILFGDN